MTLTIYQVCENDNQCNLLYDISKKIFYNNVYDVCLNLYSKRQLKSDYIGIFKYDIKNTHKFELNEDAITNDYDMYISPLFKNKKYSVFNDLNGTYLYDIIIKLLKYLKLPENIKPKLRIYDNSVIAKKDIYKDYIKNYLIPTTKYLDILDVSDNIKSDVLDLLWTIYYDINKDKISLKILRKKYYSTDVLINVVDYKTELKYYSIKDKYRYNVIKYLPELEFKSNVIPGFNENLYKLDLNIENILFINKMLYSDIELNTNFHDYNIIVHVDNVKILNVDINDYINVEECLHSSLNEIFFINDEKYDIKLIYGKSGIMELFYTLYDMKKYNIPTLYEYSEYAIRKLGIKINNINL